MLVECANQTKSPFLGRCSNRFRGNHEHSNLTAQDDDVKNNPSCAGINIPECGSHGDCDAGHTTETARDEQNDVLGRGIRLRISHE